MKTIQNKVTTLALSLFGILSFISCSNDDTPTPVNEEELITTITAVFTPVGGGNSVTLQYKDLDGEGANAPIISVSQAFEINKTYNGVLTFKNETTNPATDITTEIAEEGVDHQVFYQVTGNLNTLSYSTAASNLDANQKPIGLQSVFTTTTAATGNLVITLRHEPNKNATNVAAGNIANAGGSTDAEVTFAIEVK